MSGEPAPGTAFAAHGGTLAVHDSTGTIQATSAVLTSLGYSGEFFDASAQQQYLRARFYNPANGRFNRLDPFAGNMQDPQSLHKYAYVHGDPIQGVDPSGEWAVAVGLAVAALVTAIWAYNHNQNAARDFTVKHDRQTGNTRSTVVDVDVVRITRVTGTPSEVFGVGSSPSKSSITNAVAEMQRFYRRYGIFLRVNSYTEVADRNHFFIDGDDAGNGEISDAVSRYYSGRPVMLFTGAFTDTSFAGLTDSEKRGFAVTQSSSMAAIGAHELAHVFGLNHSVIPNWWERPAETYRYYLFGDWLLPDPVTTDRLMIPGSPSNLESAYVTDGELGFMMERIVSQRWGRIHRDGPLTNELGPDNWR